MAKKLKAAAKKRDSKVSNDLKVKKEDSPNFSNDSNACGIVGLCLSVFIPIAGIVLGILALSRKEKTPALGIIAIILSLLSIVISAVILFLIFSLPIGAFSALNTL